MVMTEETKAKFDSLKVGDILVSSCHYYGVFYDFYKVVGKTNASLKLQQLQKKGFGSPNSCNYSVKPTETLIGEVMTKRPDRNGYLNFPYHYCAVDRLYKPDSTYTEDHMY